MWILVADETVDNAQKGYTWQYITKNNVKTCIFRIISASTGDIKFCILWKVSQNTEFNERKTYPELIYIYI